MTDEPAFPIFSVADLPAVQRFYERLGFVATYQFPADGAPQFVTMERRGSVIGLGAGADTERVAYWIYVDDVDTTYRSLCEAGAAVIAEPTDEPWGERVARVRDPAGNAVYIGAAIADPDGAG